MCGPECARSVEDWGWCERVLVAGVMVSCDMEMASELGSILGGGYNLDSPGLTLGVEEVKSDIFILMVKPVSGTTCPLNWYPTGQALQEASSTIPPGQELE